MTTSVTRSCFTKQHQNCKTKTKTDFLVPGRSCPKTDGLRPHHCYKYYSVLLSEHGIHGGVIMKQTLCPDALSDANHCSRCHMLGVVLCLPTMTSEREEASVPLTWALRRQSLKVEVP